MSYKQLLIDKYIEHYLQILKLQSHYRTIMQDTHNVIKQKYWLSLFLNKNNLLINIVNYTTNKIVKWSAPIIIKTQEKQGNCQGDKTESNNNLPFESYQQLFEFLKVQENYSIDFTSKMLMLKWKVVASGFEKAVVYRVRMIEDQLTPMENLRIQNLFLKRKLSKYQNFTIQESKVDNKSESKVINLDKDLDQYEKKSFVVKVQNHDDQQSQLQISKLDLTTQEPKNECIQKNQERKPNRGRKRKGQSLIDQLSSLQKNTKQKKKRGRKRKNPIIQPNTTQNPTNTASSLPPQVKINFPNGDYYHGCVKNNLYDGPGTYFSTISGVFEGEWLKGKANGYGISRDPLGNRHSGIYVDDKRNGLGKDQYVNGERYEGGFVEDMKEGVGRYLYVNGDVYDGQWKKDMYHGKGKQIYADGSSYQGTWIADQKDGQGVFTSHCGQKFKQIWSKGNKQFQKQL